MSRLSLFALLLVAGMARGNEPESAAEPAPAPAETAEPAAPPEGDSSLFKFLRSDPEAYSIISVARGLSAHKANYLLPVTYNSRSQDDRWEVVYQISAKQRIFDRNLYFAYSQKSFWQFYSPDESAPFRETVYNPQLFYRWTPDPQRFHHWGADIGIDHESNGQPLPNSRSWNRIYLAPFQARQKQLAYFKFWYRIPEDNKESETDARGDDNPDIEDYTGHAEFRLQRQFGDHGRLAAMMLRGNPGTGRGAVEIFLSQPNADNSLFYSFSIWHGYGESLIDYNRSVTRIGLGLMLSR